MAAPAYFERIRLRAAERWKQLESDPELAGPWHQLFRQVQSPRHVLSELLQNADDAKATEASVCIKNGVFIFSHNGEDFCEEHFESICRFGFSNKKSLHTIGFRGVGFKSTFSLGDRVEVLTPTLSVAFYRKRFTEPKWIDAPHPNVNLTEVHVTISDEHRRREVEKNLAEWLKSPMSLLFFRHIRRICIEEQEICWKAVGPGPVANSEWMTLVDKADHQFLLVRSAPEAFPEDALLEIKQERAFNLDENTEFPPCQVEVVLGAKGRLFVVLPTGVETTLPFACNAPFIQDPARLKIKDPDISPTNRWLLERAGKFTAAVMLQWLQRSNIEPAERCLAYAILPTTAREDNSIEGSCEAIIEQAFKAELEDSSYLLTDDGELVPAHQSIVLPNTIFEIWSTETAVKLFDPSGRSPISRYVAEANLKKLISWGVVVEIQKADILRILRTARPPRPKTWQRLLTLWAYLSSDLAAYPYNTIKEQIQILPVQGKDILYAAKDVVRLGEKRLLQSGEDWDFLSEHLLVLNQNWLRHLAEQRRTAEEQESKALGDAVESCYSVLSTLGFKEASDVSKVCEQVAAIFFRKEQVAVSNCIRLSQITAKFGATTGESFRFVTKDLTLRSAKYMLLFDADGEVEALLPDSWCDSHLLHPDYACSFVSCSREEWDRWIASGKAGLFTFVPPIQTRENIWGRKEIEKEVRLRGCIGYISYPYKYNSFLIEDWKFDDSHWRHWETLSENNNRVWGQVVAHVLAQPETFWQKCKSARALQVATTGNTKTVTYEELLPSWILKLRALPCLPDTRGTYHKPTDLLRRTPETESLLDVEPFIHGRIDNETVRRLLNLLGVRFTPTGPERLLDCLRTLAKAEKPPVYEVEKWYRRLDHLIDKCSTDDVKKIKQAFAEEKLILTNSNRWVQATGVFVSSNEEDVPGAEILKPSVSELTLWTKVGVAERPTADLAIQWLKGLPANQTLPLEEVKRVRSLLSRHALLIWKECEHWLNLAGEWAPIEMIEYAMTMQSLVAWKHLHEWVKKKTADFQRLSAEISEAPPFSMLPALAAQIEDRFLTPPNFQGRSERKPWLNKLGAELRRISLESEDETERIRALAARLEETIWQTAPVLELIPYIKGVPGGTPRQAEAVWLDNILYVDQRPLPKLARNVAQELGRVFLRSDINDAIKLCFERPPEFVLEYLEENFKLVPRQEIEPLTDESILESDITTQQETMPVIEASEDKSSVMIEVTKGKTETEDTIIMVEREITGTETEDEVLQTSDNQGETELISRRTVKPSKPSIIERFAAGLGYKKSGEDRFLCADGSWIGKSNGNRFPWEMRSASGELIRYFWPKDHCLEREPLQLEADVWGLIDKFPKMYALVLSNPQDSPVEVTGERIKTMRDKGEITLYPATYRIVYKSEEQL